MFDWIKPEALIRRQAANLLVRADADPSPENLERLEKWRASNRRHARALGKAEAVLSSTGLLARSPIALERSSELSSRNGDFGRMAIAASIAAALLLVPMFYLVVRHRGSGDAIEAVMLSTGPGETRDVSLADGSRLVIAGSSAVRVNLARGRRSAQIEHGSARFSIAQEGSPFAVRCGDTTVQIRAGVVDVSQNPGSTHVELVSGAAEISSVSDPSRRETIDAPATIDRPTAIAGKTAKESLQSSLPGRLSFDGARLADVVASANRYGRSQIMIPDPTVADLRVTLVYRAGDTEGLAQSLASAFHLEVHKNGSGVLVVERASPKS